MSAADDFELAMQEEPYNGQGTRDDQEQALVRWARKYGPELLAKVGAMEDDPLPIVALYDGIVLERDEARTRLDAVRGLTFEGFNHWPDEYVEGWNAHAEVVRRVTR